MNQVIGPTCEIVESLDGRAIHTLRDTITHYKSGQADKKDLPKLLRQIEVFWEHLDNHPEPDNIYNINIGFVKEKNLTREEAYLVLRMNYQRIEAFLYGEIYQKD